ncbi:hypothetical protein [Rhodococcus sp. NPDC060176]|uniref:hypothetical protein n=1 Tax=Rhodococcus sp. NPDC060176 TaxID=3347062 RepID=UPI00364BF760
MFFARYHDVTVTRSALWHILHNLDLNRLPASQRYKRTQTDGTPRQTPPRPPTTSRRKFIEPLGQTGEKKRYYSYTAIDDCTRLRV